MGVELRRSKTWAAVEAKTCIGQRFLSHKLDRNPLIFSNRNAAIEWLLPLIESWYPLNSSYGDFSHLIMGSFAWAISQGLWNVRYTGLSSGLEICSNAGKQEQ